VEVRGYALHPAPRLSERSAGLLDDWLGTCLPGALDTPAGDARPVLVLWSADAGAAEELEPFLDQARRGRLALVVLADALADEGRGAVLAEAAGVALEPPLPRHPVRPEPGPGATWLLEGFAPGLELPTSRRLVGKVESGTEIALVAPLGLERRPLATWRAATGVGVFAADLAGLADTSTGAARRLLHRFCRMVAGPSSAPPARPLGVGLLGAGAIAAEHVDGIRATPWLELVAIAERDPARRVAAGSLEPEARLVEGVGELAADDRVDLVVVSTPPNSHADLAAQLLSAGKHVVVEKPMALSASEADRLLAEADATGRSLSVYQNRHFDPDFAAIEQLVRSGSLGELFHLEAFVGGFGHPCNQWHSDQEVSGGVAFDWGAHYLEQVLSLFDAPVDHVRASAHKRRWWDVTNADQLRLTLRFADGTEADFIHSDLAAALKPKWYLLGTDGAVVAHWRQERVVARSAIGTLEEDVLAPADAPASVEHHLPDGSVTKVALGEPDPAAFHRELADRLVFGQPTSTDPLRSRDVVAVLESATRSATAGATPVPCRLRSR